MISYGLEETEVDGIFGCVSANHEVSQLDEKKLGNKVENGNMLEEEKQRTTPCNLMSSYNLYRASPVPLSNPNSRTIILTKGSF